MKLREGCVRKASGIFAAACRIEGMFGTRPSGK